MQLPTLNITLMKRLHLQHTRDAMRKSVKKKKLDQLVRRGKSATFTKKVMAHKTRKIRELPYYQPSKLPPSAKWQRPRDRPRSRWKEVIRQGLE